MLQHCGDVTLLEHRICVSPPCFRLAALTYSAFIQLARFACSCSLSTQPPQHTGTSMVPRPRPSPPSAVAAKPGRRLFSSSEVVRCWPRSRRKHAERQCARLRRMLDSRVRMGARWQRESGCQCRRGAGGAASRCRLDLLCGVGAWVARPQSDRPSWAAHAARLAIARHV